MRARFNAHRGSKHGLSDNQERVNLASKHPDIVSQLAKQMATYTPYVDPSLSAEELRKYECVTTNVSGGIFPSPWWGEFNGPVRTFLPLGLRMYAWVLELTWDVFGCVAVLPTETWVIAARIVRIRSTSKVRAGVLVLLGIWKSVGGGERRR